MKISQFPLIESVDGSEQLAIVKDGANGKMKTSAIIAKAKEGLVPQITGKGLSTNDYTNADKTKLDALPTKTELDASIASKQPAITTSDDIAPLGSDKLALTDKAKMAELIATAKAAGIAYNPKTGYFEYNTLTDITAEQIRLILLFPQRPPYNVFVNNDIRHRLRTNLWIACGESTSDVPVSLPQVFLDWSAAEVITLDNGISDAYSTKINGSGTFRGCTSLHTILGVFRFNSAPNAEAFRNCTQLRSFRLRQLAYDIDLHWSPLIDLESIQYMVDNATNTAPINITLHPDAHARLTEELIAQAAEKQITFATT